MKFAIIYRSIIFFFVVFLSNNYVQICLSFNLTILHNNDFHTHYEQMNTYGSDCKPDEQCFGGVARTVSKVKEIRNQYENVLFLNAGDHFQGTVWYTFLKWQVVAQFVKLMRHDAMALGNHEFDDGVKGLVPFIRNMSYNNQAEGNLPILGCNINASREPDLRDLIKPSIVREINGRKIAIIGYITPDTAFLASPGKNLKFNDEIDSIRSEIDSLKAEHGDSLNIFIALGHSGFGKDKEIAQKISDLDVVVGGHSHTFLYTGQKLPSIEIPEDKYPVVFDHGSDGKTLVVQDFEFGKYLGKLDLFFDEDGKIVDYGGNPILLDNSTIEDPETSKQVQDVAVVINEQSGKVIGSTLVQLSNSNCRSQECNLGNAIADAFVSHYIELTRKSKRSWTSVPIALVNGGSVRTTISAGNITRRNAVDASPFGNQVGILRVNGSVLWSILQHSGSRCGSGAFMQVSGLRLQYDLSKPSGNRLVKVRVRCTDCLVPHYEDFDISKTYSVAINKYLVDGGDNYTMIDPNDFSTEGDLDYEIFVRYVQDYSPIFTGLEDRIIFVSGQNLGSSIYNNNSSPLNVLLVLCVFLIAFRQHF